MLLVADSGSTKTEWAFAEIGKPALNLRTIGYNPYFIDSDGIKDSLKTELGTRIDAAKVSKLFFYGAGCGTPEKIGVVRTALQSFFPNANVLVDHDLLGAAR